MRPNAGLSVAWKTSALVPRCLLAASLTWLHVGPCLAAEDGKTTVPPADSASLCVLAAADSDSGQIEIRQGDQPVLRYNYHTVESPEKYLDKINVNNRKYARPRSNYIHPLYGPGVRN